MPPSLPDRLARCEKHRGHGLLLKPDQLTRRRGDVCGRESGELTQPTLGGLLEDSIRDRENPSRYTYILAREELENC